MVCVLTTSHHKREEFFFFAERIICQDQVMMNLILYVSSFFLEKNMFAFFLNILRQKSGRYVCVQLLQTLNILFENISHETSLCKFLY